MVGDERHLSEQDVMSDLDDIFARTANFCNRKVDYGIRLGTDDGFTQVNVKKASDYFGRAPIVARVGVKSLVENRLPSGEVRDIDAVRAVFGGFHESAHIWQYAVGYVQKDCKLDEVRNMASDYVLGRCFPEYRTAMYLSDTSELFADKYAALQTEKFFNNKALSDERYAAIPVSDILCSEFVRRRGFLQPRFSECDSANAIAKVCSDLMDDSSAALRFSCLFNIPKDAASDNLRQLMADASAVSGIVNAVDGFEQTDLLCKYVGKNHPEKFHNVMCLQNDYCRQTMAGAVERVQGKIARVIP